MNESLNVYHPNRREETILTGVHVSQLYLTHYFLLKGERPVCISSEEFLTLKHTLLHCMVLLLAIRKSYVQTCSVRILFKNTTLEDIFPFLNKYECLLPVIYFFNYII